MENAIVLLRIFYLPSSLSKFYLLFKDHFLLTLYTFTALVLLT